jgi:hypothetical protein
LLPRLCKSNFWFWWKCRKLPSTPAHYRASFHLWRAIFHAAVQKLWGELHSEAGLLTSTKSWMPTAHSPRCRCPPHPLAQVFPVPFHAPTRACVYGVMPQWLGQLGQHEIVDSDSAFSSQQVTPCVCPFPSSFPAKHLPPTRPARNRGRHAVCGPVFRASMCPFFNPQKYIGIDRVPPTLLSEPFAWRWAASPSGCGISARRK